MKKTGIFGGTFDPIHFGHIRLAEAARDSFELDVVYFMPSDDPYYKSKSNVSSFDDRYEMTKLALKNRTRLFVSDFEKVNDTDGYTVNTLNNYKRLHPDEELFFIIGGDSLFTMENWKDVKKIFKLATILVSKRKDANKGASGKLKVSSYAGLEAQTDISPDDEIDAQISYLSKKYKAKIYNLHARQTDVSSSELREKIKNNIEVKNLLPKKVIEYIKEKKLYQK